jgi:hypothetical protein
MRTTLNIDDDVLVAAKQLAKEDNLTVGKIVSNLARQTLTRGVLLQEEPLYRNGFRLLPRTGQIITSEMVKKWLA